MSNNSSQTLFRFTSLRNPELTTTKDNPKFITREPFVGGFFDNILSEKTDQNTTKLAYLTSRAKEFKSESNYISTEDILKSKYSYLYNLKFPQLITEITEIFQNKTSEQVTENITLTIEQIKVLWDNLIYQVLTEENFYLKEKFFEILRKRNYFTFIYNRAENQATKEVYDNVKNAKIVMPDELFVDNVKQKPKLQVSHTTLAQLQQKNEKLQVLTQAKAEREKLVQLKSEFSKAQTIYQKNYAKALKIQQETYEESIRVEKEAYELRLLQAEANLAVDVTEAQRKLALANVVKPDYDTFNFVFREELDAAFLEDKLSSETLITLDKVVSKKAINIDFEENQEAERPSGSINFDQDEFESFNDVLKTIDEKIALQDQLIIANTEVEKQQFVNVGGVFLPVSNKITSLYEMEYECNLIGEILPNNQTIYNFDLRFLIPDNSWRIQKSTFKFYKNNIESTESNNEVDYDSYNKVISYGNIFIGKDILNSSKFISELEFTNGAKAYLVIIGNGSSGIFQNYSYKGNLIITELPTNLSTENNFIPTGFGVRRLGIADYLKVEQSTHAYVPGEVAHIENIMAREYREKSTRRLSRSENTITSSSETEREQLTDTTTATRFEMQTEIAKMMSETNDFSSSINTSYSGLSGNFRIDAGASFANNRSKEESSRTATTQAQDITARALDRIVSKVKEERISKVIEEFEENNMHGFDNRQGDQHVVGVYRWVDKIMKNQIFNYGKRMMFEFMIPQPSKIHQLAMFKEAPEKELIDKPIDPRKSKDWNLYLQSILASTGYENDHQKALRYWAGVYNVKLEKEPEQNISIGKSLAGDYNKDLNKIEFASFKDEIVVPEGYKAIKAYAAYNAIDDSHNTHKGVMITVGNVQLSSSFSSGNGLVSLTKSADLTGTSFSNGSLPITLTLGNYFSGSVSISINCNLTIEKEREWKQEAYNQIISAYEEALEVFEDKVKKSISTDETDSNIKETNANFYRQMERDVLKHNCMGYLVDPNVLGTKLYDKEKLEDFEILKNKNLDDYTSLAKFMEQAFEWDIMSYNFYPYYWGNKNEWGELYQSESIDPLFRSFLQSGMARVVVTVKPGFEDAVQFYMSTGRIWSGGEVPVIGDPMYLSIVDEMREPVGDKVGKFWMTRIPTSLNILQAESIGLKVENALPHTIEDKTNCENPEMIVDKTDFESTGALLGEESLKEENIISGDWTDTTSVD